MVGHLGLGQRDVGLIEDRNQRVVRVDMGINFGSGQDAGRLIEKAIDPRAQPGYDFEQQAMVGNRPKRAVEQTL